MHIVARVEVAHRGYESWPPVFQWETDDATRPQGNSRLNLGGAEYDISWYEHPADLVYVLIRAVAPDDPLSAKGTPAVNLVYDRRRAAVVAIYGCADDLHPFVEAFRVGCLGDGRQDRKNG